MSDKGHELTDKKLAELEKKLKAHYKQASDEVQKKLDDYLKTFKAKDARHLADLQKDFTKENYEEYIRWRQGQVLISERWEEMRQSLAEDYHNANVIARSIIDGYMPDIYALNHNYGTYDVEHSALVDTSYTLYDRQTVERLMRDDPDMLPPPGKKVSKRIAEGKDMLWNKSMIQSSMWQSITQGESMNKIAKRLAQTVGDKDMAAAVRNARTMTTGAECAGRVDSYKRAQSMGIHLQQEWMATLDGRTRHTHRQLHGERIDVGGTFSNGCRFPGDPHGPAEEVYNCRCTLVSAIKGFEGDKVTYSPKLGDMSFEEWVGEHEQENKVVIEDNAKTVEKVSAVEETSGFKQAKTIEEAEKFALENGVRHVDYSDLPLETANLLNEAAMTLPEDIRPAYIGSGKSVQKVTGKKFSRKEKDYYGVHMDVLQMHFGEYPNIEYDFEGGNVVGISTAYKTPEKIHKSKVEGNKAYAEKHDGHTQFFNEDGKSSAFHEMGHIYADKKGIPEGFASDAERWLKESKCDMLKSTDEAWAEAWGAYHTKNPDLPDYIAEYVEKATNMPVNKQSIDIISKSGIIESERRVSIKNVDTGGRRNEKPLSRKQVEQIKDYASELGMPKEQIRYGEHYNTSYGSTFDRLYIGTDALPSDNPQSANSRLSWRSSIAHEIVGHRETCLKGWEQSDELLDEIQASIRAARFAPGLTNLERINLLRDAGERAHNNGLQLKNIKHDLHIKVR